MIIKVRKRTGPRTNLFLFNLSSDPNFPKSLDLALENIDKVHPVTLHTAKTQPKVIPGLTYQIKSNVRQAYNRSRDQVNVQQLINATQMMPYIQKHLYMYRKIILLDEDLYRSDLNWLFGGCSHLNYLILSNNRIQNLIHQQFMLQHELGHLFSAPNPSRPGVVEDIGPHCTNPLCAMQQKLSIQSSNAYAQQRARAKAEAYCIECFNDIARSPYYSYPPS